MAANVTFGRLKSDARLLCDKREDPFVSDDEVGRLVNMRAREIWEKLVDARGSGYYATEGTIAIVAGTARYPLPADFFELSSVTLEWGPQDHELVNRVTGARQRTPYENSFRTWSRYDAKGYQLRASQIEFLPTPTTAVTCRLQYVPVFTDLVNDSDTFDGINGWDKAIALGAAIDIITMDKQPPSALLQQFQAQLDRIEDLKNERDAEAPLQIVDVNPDGVRGARLWMASPWDETFDGYFG